MALQILLTSPIHRWNCCSLSSRCCHKRSMKFPSIDSRSSGSATLLPASAPNRANERYREISPDRQRPSRRLSAPEPKANPAALLESRGRRSNRRRIAIHVPPLLPVSARDRVSGGGGEIPFMEGRRYRRRACSHPSQGGLEAKVGRPPESAPDSERPPDAGRSPATRSLGLPRTGAGTSY